MQCKHPLVKKLRKAGASTKSAVRVLNKINPIFLRHTYKYYGTDISALFVFSEQPEGSRYWRDINKRLGN